jgi:RNA polymerase sigma-70 factor (ECF subfamily)
MQSDEQLMQEFQKGSSQAFEELFARHKNAVYGFFRRRLNHPARAEELAQETFVIILRSAGRYEPRARFRTYLFSVALKQVWSERRRELRQARAAEGSVEGGRQSDPVAGVWIRDLLARMDDDHREVLMLREYEQLSYEEIAEVLVVPVNTVRSRLSRARAELRALLDQESVKGVSR